ncbi:uncharacterized protein LOC105701824 [Orussus abietinus]|uniref:uncharacterized protein LOC105701824 n=1 Tax=Orussus abietinus TaxID=222816 RepID=UPI000625ABCC|nr:uncharacterized protein LOC105701824 [Orussus abietinus]
MKTFVAVLLVFAVTFLANAEPSLPRHRPGPGPLINRPRPPTQPRFRRSPEPEPEPRKKGSVYVDVQKPMSGPDRRPSIGAGYQHKIFENKHGHISAGGGFQKYPGQKPQSNVGITGSFRFRRSPEPEPEPQKKGSVYVDVQKPMSGPDRRPSIGAGYQHKIFENKRGHISAGAGVQKNPGQRPQGNVGLQGSFRFRRSPEPEPQKKGSIYVDVQKPMSGPDRRPSIGAGYQHKIFENKHGHISAGAGVQKNPGQRPQGNVGLQGSFRFRRDAEGNEVVEELEGADEVFEDVPAVEV